MSSRASSRSPTNFSDAGDLETILAEVDRQVDYLLEDISAFHSMEKEFTKIVHKEKKCDYAEIVKFRIGFFEKYLGNIMLNAQFISNERLSDWYNTAGGATKEAKELRVIYLMEKLQRLHNKMVEMRKQLADIAIY